MLMDGPVVCSQYTIFFIAVFISLAFQMQQLLIRASSVHAHHRACSFGYARSLVRSALPIYDTSYHDSADIRSLRTQCEGLVVADWNRDMFYDTYYRACCNTLAALPGLTSPSGAYSRASTTSPSQYFRDAICTSFNLRMYLHVSTVSDTDILSSSYCL
jgi:hypothetical protein